MATLSVCMIVKNESKRLARCLRSLAGSHDELIIVDTGSSDDTKAIAASFGARVFDFVWTHDFSAARNYALQQATSDWVLSIDADEQLAPGSQLKASLQGTRVSAMTVQMDELLDDGRHYFEAPMRLFRRDPRVRFEGRIHEQVTASVARAGLSCAPSRVRLLHDGYTRDVIAETNKLARNDSLIRLEIARAENDPYWQYQLGKNQMMLRDYTSAIISFGAALERLVVNATPPPFVLDLYTSLLRLLLATREYQSAVVVAEEARAAFPSSPDVSFFHGQSLLELGRREASRKAFAHTVRHKKECQDPALPALAAAASRLLSSLTSAAPKEGTTVVNARHGVFSICSADPLVGRALDAKGEWCEAELELVLSVLKPGMWVVDVGAHLGAHTIPIAKRVGHLVAFESRPDLHELLCTNVALNWLSNVTVLQACASERSGQLKAPEPNDDLVDAIRIDDLDLARCDLLKLDCGGDEVASVRGAVATIKRHRPLILVANETLCGSHALLELLSTLGYDAYWVLTPRMPGCQPKASLFACPHGAAVRGLLAVRGMDDDWQQAAQRLRRADVHAEATS